MLKIEHIAFAVKDLNSSNQLFSRLLNEEIYKEEIVASEQVKTSFLRLGATKIELLEALSPDSPIARFIEKKGEGMHHIAFEVADIKAEMQRLRKEGFELLSTEPKKGADNKLICFVHPKSTGGVLIELCQEILPKADVL
jgi:methylmalonyl-CoA/ethylmalonyl-CoA epimerase